MKKNGPWFMMIVLALVDIFALYLVCSKEINVFSTAGKEVTSSGRTITREEVIKTEEEIKQKEELESPLVESIKEPVPTPEPTPTSDPIVYDGLTMVELSEKLERSLHSTLKGYGSLFASYAIELGIDPYLALAITLHETGCEWTCSTLVRKCNNVGGMKGSPGCGGGAYKAFATLEEGIKSYLDNLYYNYYKYGLTTPEAMNAKYAESKDWARNVNVYISKIRAR